MASPKLPGLNPDALRSSSPSTGSNSARAAGERIKSVFAERLQGLSQKAAETTDKAGGGDKLPDAKTSGLQGATPEQIDQLAQQYLKGVEQFYQGLSTARNGPKVEIELAQYEED